MTSTTIAIRAAAVDDYDAFLGLYPELAVPEAAPSLERFAQAIVPEAFVAVVDDVVGGLLWCRRRGGTLHVVYLITSPRVRRRGVGMALMAQAAQQARALGLARWFLNVKPDNTAAIALYERCGMRTVMRSTGLRVPLSSIASLPRPTHDGAADIVVTVLDTDVDDAAYEMALGLERHELQAMRALPGRVLFGARANATDGADDVEEGAPVGVMGFDAAFPGANPFRARDVGVARALLDVISADGDPRARPQHDHLFIFVEGDDVLEAAFVDAGATVSLRVLRMQGDVDAFVTPA